jgi:hypothetical protein
VSGGGGLVVAGSFGGELWRGLGGALWGFAVARGVPGWVLGRGGTGGREQGVNGGGTGGREQGVNGGGTGGREQGVNGAGTGGREQGVNGPGLAGSRTGAGLADW